MYASDGLQMHLLVSLPPEQVIRTQNHPRIELYAIMEHRTTNLTPRVQSCQRTKLTRGLQRTTWERSICLSLSPFLQSSVEGLNVRVALLLSVPMMAC
jgi:hypothetical protein